MTRPRRPVRPVRPIADPPQYLRQRQLGDGFWRVWWEPRPEVRRLGMTTVELSADKPSWSIAQAIRLNREADRLLADNGARRAPTGRTIRDLADNYRASPAWARLAPKTQASYDRLLPTILTRWGGEAVIEFTKPVMAEWWETLFGSGRVTLARQLIRMMSILFSRAEIIGWRPEGSNPCFRMKMTAPQPRRKRAGWAEIDALTAAADRLGLHGIGTAVLLAALMGQRATDLRLARLSDFHLDRPATDGQPPVWVWRLARSKRGTRTELDLHPEVAARLALQLLRPAEALEAPACPRPDTGGAYGEELLSRQFSRVRERAIADAPRGAAGRALREGLAGLQLRDLRRSFGILARAAGATREDVADALGNTAARDPALADVYMPGTRATAGRAVAAVRRPTPKGE